MKNVKTQKSQKLLSGKRVFLYFLMFFVSIAIVDAFFVYSAISTHTGVVTENPYEKGLAYNKILEQAKQQENINVISTQVYENGKISMTLHDREGSAIENATVNAKIMQPIKNGKSKNVILEYSGDGLYTAVFQDEVAGHWRAYLEAIWNNQNYQKMIELTVQ